MTRNQRTLAVVLRCLGGLDCLALTAVVVPRAWMQTGCAWLELGEFPHAPLAGYLARSASALHALHGAAVVFVSFDVVRCGPLIRFLAVAALLHGGVMLGIDVIEGMPPWWTFAEGPCFAATGGIVLVFQNRAR